MSFKNWKDPYAEGGPFSRLRGGADSKDKKEDSERRIQLRLVRYLKSKYPTVRFISTLGGERFSEHQAIMVADMQWARGAPDMLVFHPNGRYVGLAIELKRASAKPFKKDGELKANLHLQEQADWLDYLSDCGWRAVFGIGYDNALDILDQYMNLRV